MKNFEYIDEDQIIAKIYDSALQATLWQQVLEDIVHLTESKTAIFTSLNQLNPYQDFTYSHNIPIEGLLAYQDEKVKVIDMKLHAPLWQSIGVGETLNQNLSSYAFMPYGSDEFIFYEKCLKPTGIAHIGAVLLEEGKHRWSVFAIHRAPDSTPFQESELNLLARLGKHMRRALQIHRQLNHVKQETSELYQILNCLKNGVILLNEKKEIQYSNPKAQQILERSSLLFPDQNNRLKTLNNLQQKLNNALDGALFNTINLNIREFSSVVALYHQPKDIEIMLTVFPLSQIQMRETSLLDAKQQIAVFITEPTAGREICTHFLRDFYQLSKREIELCELFLNGKNLEDIAIHCQLSLQSVRTYLRNIFSKTNCTSQAELLRLLSSLTQDFEHID